MKALLSPGSVVVVTGDKGSGKSNLSMVLCEIALEKDPEIEILSNVMIDDKSDWEYVDRYHHFEGEREFLWWLSVCKRPIAVLDEAGIFASTGASDNAGNRKRRGQLESFIKLIRKWDLSLLWIDQVFEGSVPPAIRKMSDWNIDCPRQGLKDIYPVDGVGGRGSRKRYPNRRLTSIPYLDKGMSAFEMDLPDKMGLGDVYRVCAGVHPDKFRSVLQTWLMSLGVDPPKNARFPEVSTREIKKGDAGSGRSCPPGRNRFSGMNPSEKIPGRVRVWSLLQVRERIPTKEMVKLTGLDRTTVQRYRNEYTGRLKAKDPGSSLGQ